MPFICHTGLDGGFSIFNTAGRFLRKEMETPGEITISNFIDKGISVIIMTNSENGERIFQELLETLVGELLYSMALARLYTLQPFKKIGKQQVR